MKIFRLFLLILTSLFILHCKKIPSDEVHLFNNIHLRLMKNEVIERSSPKIISEYFTYPRPQLFRLPLLLSISNRNYKIYISLPVNTSLKRYISSINTDKNDSLKIQTDHSSYAYINYKINNTYISEFFVIKEKNQFFLLSETESKDIQENVFNLKNISNRFVLSKN